MVYGLCQRLLPHLATTCQALSSSAMSGPSTLDQAANSSSKVIHLSHLQGPLQLTHAEPTTAPRIPPSSHQQQAHVQHTADPRLPVTGHEQHARPGTRTHTPGHQQCPHVMNAVVYPGPHMQGHHQPFPQQPLWPSQPQQAHQHHPQALTISSLNPNPYQRRTSPQLCKPSPLLWARCVTG